MNFNNPFRSTPKFRAKRYQTNIENHGLFSTLSHDTIKQLQSLIEEHGLEPHISTFTTGDKEFERNPFRAADFGKHSAEYELAALKERLQGTTEVNIIKPLEGTGPIAARVVEPYKRQPNDRTIEIWVVSPQPQAREVYNRSLNLPTVGQGRNTVPHFVVKRGTSENESYAEAFAELMETLSLVEGSNIPPSGVMHRTIPQDANAGLRLTIQETVEDCLQEFGSQPRERIGFTPEALVAPDTSLADREVYAEDPPIARVVLPIRYQGKNVTEHLFEEDSRVNLKEEFGPVPEVRVLLTQELSDRFLRLVRTDYPRWFYERADEYSVWRKVVPRRKDPQQAYGDFVTKKLGVRDPDVLAALQEVGYDDG